MPIAPSCADLPVLDRGMAAFDRLVGDVAGLDAVDVGAGAGGLVRALVKRGARPIGIECGRLPLAAARRADPAHPERYRQGVAQDMPVDTASQDLVIFSNSLHHVPVDAMDRGLDEAVRILKPGGRLYIAEPVADGDLWAIVRLFDDETHVRQQAYAAIARARARHRLAELAELHYRVPARYRDFDAFVDEMIQVDEARAPLIERQRETLRSLFDASGTRGPDGVTFTGPSRANLFRKPL